MTERHEHKGLGGYKMGSLGETLPRCAATVDGRPTGHWTWHACVFICLCVHVCYMCVICDYYIYNNDYIIYCVWYMFSCSSKGVRHLKYMKLKQKRYWVAPPDMGGGDDMKFVPIGGETPKRG